MKKLFRKAITVLGSVALVGATIGGAAAAAYPAPFNSGSYAVVYGASSQDSAAATTVAGGLPSLTGTTTLSGGSGVTELEVPLGSVLNFSTSDIKTSLTDSKIDSLLDEKIRWDDGGASGSDDYNIHEEIRVGSMTIKTTLNKNDFEKLAALDNDRQLEYRYVFDDAFPVSHVGMDNSTGTADDLYLTILGKSYEISAMTATTISVVTSEEISVGIGESVTVQGKTFTLDDLSSSSARINGVTVAEGATKKIDGLQVQVDADSIFYNDNFPEQATLTLKIGEDISKTYSNAEEYIGEPEEDYQWEWVIQDPSTAGGYIGVKYSHADLDEDDEVAYTEGSYLLPENFGEVRFDGLTDMEYKDFKIYFDSSVDLYNASTTSSADAVRSNVLVIESVDGITDSIKIGNYETNTIYLKWADDDEDMNSDQNNASLEVYFKDVDDSIATSNWARFVTNYSTQVANGDTIGTDPDLANIDLGGDTIISITADVTGGDMTLIFTDDVTGNVFTLDIAGSTALGEADGDLEWFGATTTAATSQEIAEATDIIVTSTNIGTYDNDVLTYNGIIIKEPENSLEKDEVVISVPTDRVYATVSVTTGGTATTSDSGVATFMDNQASSFAGRNIVVVGGSCINSVAATLLGGGALCGDDFTGNTAVGPGQFLIQSFDYNGKIATLVAGYEKDDTAKGATYLANTANAVSTTAGSKIIVQTATETVLSTV